MEQAASAPDTPKASRLDRRKARTRQALIDAAIRLMAEGRGERASIQEITEEADIGFGSFYNHFESKEQLFRVATQEVMDHWGELLDSAHAGITDPAVRLAVGVRLSGRLAWTHPAIAGFLVGVGLDGVYVASGLTSRGFRDIQAGQKTGRFTVRDAEVAMSAIEGGMIGLLRVHGRAGGDIDESSVDELAEGALRLLGVPAREAARIVARPLPSTAAV
ncbi:MAG: TetR/AcrR family transcriptional regulator [Acidimicrobiales bacterium]|jgi:AcrR family transcriptional regulator